MMNELDFQTLKDCRDTLHAARISGFETPEAYHSIVEAEDTLQTLIDEEVDRRSADYPDNEPDIDDSVHYCPNCERPNQFGEMCVECELEFGAHNTI